MRRGYESSKGNGKENTIMKSKFNVSGMSCAVCVNHVEKSVNKLDGVKKVNVSLLSNSMIVEYDNNVLDHKKIIESVKKAGYGCMIDDGKLVNKDKINVRRTKLIISLVLMVILLYLSMGHMINLPHIHDSFINGIVQLIVLIPIIIINFFFFSDGFNKLFKKAPNMNSLVAIASVASTLYGIYILILVGMHKIHHPDFYFESAGTNFIISSIDLVVFPLDLYSIYFPKETSAKTVPADSK